MKRSDEVRSVDVSLKQSITLKRLINEGSKL